MRARIANIALGLWLFVSSFLWPHTPAQLHNAWVVGIIVVTAGLIGISGVHWPRHVNAACGGWLIVSALFLSRGGGATFWNHVIVGFALAVFGMSPSIRDFRRRAAVPP